MIKWRIIFPTILSLLLASCKATPIHALPTDSLPAPTLVTPTLTPMPTPTPEYVQYGFVSAEDVVTPVIVDVRYYSDYNFMGKRVDGYNAPKILLTAQAAQTLQKVADIMEEKGYILKIYDGYRPVRAVEEFVKWTQDPDEQGMKDVFFPNVDKEDLISLGYLAKHSTHSRGSTVDLTIVYADTGEDVDMGSTFDFMDRISWYNSKAITKEQKQNRTLLKETMEDCGFESYSREWWHFTLKDEPYPDTYFNFPVE